MVVVNRKRGSTPRVSLLLKRLHKRGMSDRSGEWFTPEMLPDIAKDMGKSSIYVEAIPIIERRAMAFKGMLEAMVDKKNSKKTHSFEIKPGELIVGVIPMGSLGLGKVFPNYLTDMERDVAFFSARDVESVLAHNVPDFQRVLHGGLKAIIDTCNNRLDSLHSKRSSKHDMWHVDEKRISFYKAVRTCCKAVVGYAKAFARLAGMEAKKTINPKRKAELKKIAQICRRVPLGPATSFYEALFSIWFVHLALHSSTSHLSLGRLDQILQPYLDKSLEKGEIDQSGALELLECFLIKCAERLNLTTEFSLQQDHCDFSTGMGNSPFFVDQEVTINQFMQNIVVGGLTREGADATNRCTYLLLEACKSVGLPTPTLNVRLHEHSPEELIEKVADCALHAHCGMPVIYNDHSIVPAMAQSPKIPIEEARDYVVDGCWETLLNAKCDFTYNMVNLLTVMECTLNGGALLSDSSHQLRGQKVSYHSPMDARLNTFNKFKGVFGKHLRLFSNKAGMEVYANYCLEGSVTPVPFFSALLGTCLEKGFDKTWGGASYNLGGIVYIAAPNVANALAAIKEFVYNKRVYKLSEVKEALRHNFQGKREWEMMETNFKQYAKFGNNNKAVDREMAWLMDQLHHAINKSEELSDLLFLTKSGKSIQGRRMSGLRCMTGHPGISLRERYGDDFNIIFSAGCGTFAQYAHFGLGCAASADGRKKSMPVAPNCSPTSGTAVNGVGAVLSSLRSLGLDRFGAGVVTDICLEEKGCTTDFIVEVVRMFIQCKGSIMTLTVADAKTLKKVHQLCSDVRNGIKDPAVLDEYADLSVRVGGWNGPFVTLTSVQQEDYLKRSHSPKSR